MDAATYFRSGGGHAHKYIRDAYLHQSFCPQLSDNRLLSCGCLRLNTHALRFQAKPQYENMPAGFFFFFLRGNLLHAVCCDWYRDLRRPRTAFHLFTNPSEASGCIETGVMSASGRLRGCSPVDRGIKWQIKGMVLLACCAGPREHLSPCAMPTVAAWTPLSR